MSCISVYKKREKEDEEISSKNNDTSELSKENEIKINLDRESFERLLNNNKELDRYRSRVQKNYYFDYFYSHPNGRKLLLLGSGLSLRLRVGSDFARISLKMDAEDKDDISDKVLQRIEHQCTLASFKKYKDILSSREAILNLDEISCPKDPSSLHHPIVALKKLLQESVLVKAHVPQISLDAIAPLGMSQTVRHYYPMKILDKEFTVELDMTSYPRNYIGYELELELVGENKTPYLEKFLQHLQVENIKVRSVGASKAELTFAILENDNTKVSNFLDHGAIVKLF